MSPNRPVVGIPGTRRPRTNGSATIRSTESEPSGCRDSSTVPSETVAVCPPMNSMPAASSAAATVALASAPNSSSGRASRVTSVTRIEWPLFAVINAAS